MNSQKLLFSALRNEETARVPWVPFVGCHGGSLIGVDAKEYLQNEDFIVKGIKKAVELYEPDGIPVVFDLQIEAQALGCDLEWDPENPPSVTSHPLDEGKKLKDLTLPNKDEGRFPLVLSTMEQLNEEYQEEIGLYGLITGPFTLALHLLGSNIFMEMFDNREYVLKVIDFCKEVALQTAEWYIEAGMDVIAVVDPMTSQISPADFSEIVSPAATEIFAFISDQGAYSSFFVCGDAKQNIEEMCKTQPDNLSFDENIPLQYVKDIAREYDVSFGGNLKLTTVLLMGSEDKNKRHALECMEEGGNKGYILAPGCDLPYATPPENLQAVAEVVHNKDAYDLLEDFQDLEEEEIDVELPDYENESRVYVEVFTLDSKSCAPCKYMVNSVYNSIGEDLRKKVVFNEYKIKDAESVARMKKLGVTSIPSIVIDGESKYETTPSKKELHEEIVSAIDQKS
ncbi:MAG: uroporphyrinogen decarboxylase family protein [bacterium]